jgi:hypothetical protein
MMKERPILFSAEMIRAILDGRKTQTRRVIKPQPFNTPDGSWHIELEPRSGYNSEKTLRNYLPARCPYGEPGDRLWVKETYAGDDFTGYAYRATQPDALPFGEEVTFKNWKPSIFMPRAASRFTLEILNVRVERIQDMTFDDALAEGIKRTDEDYFLAPLAGVPDYPWLHPVVAFSSLWNDINTKRGFGWEVNPWVWVIEFKKAGEA